MWHEGANLLLVARSEAALLDLQQALEASGRANQTVQMVAADLGQPDAIPRIMAEASQFAEGINVLVNNAAIQAPIGPLLDNDPAAWAQTIAVNLTAPVMLCRACIPLMGLPHPPTPSPLAERGSRAQRDGSEVSQHSRGKIINLSGGGATGPRPNFSAYASAKAALVRFSETLAQEVPHIDVNCVAPGPMGSQMLETVLQAGAERAGAREVEIAQKMIADTSPETIDRAAALCVFLASNESDGISGKLISAVWDTWSALPQHLDDLRNTDIYTLRRITPKDRDMNWGN